MNGSGVPGTPSADPPRLEVFADVDALPADARALLGDAVFAGAAWWRCVQQAAMPPGSTPCFVLCRIAGRPVALLPLRRTAASGLESLTTPYTCRYAPALAPDVPAACLIALLRFCRGTAVTRLEALDGHMAATLTQTARSAGQRVLRFAHFGNWHQTVAGMDWPSYLASRPGALRETVRRRLRRAERQSDTRLTVIDGPEGLEAGIAAYDQVYARSWKDPEPFPAFNAALMRTLAPGGTLRLALWHVGDQPVAAQFWVVEHGRATVLKLAHDEAFKPLSPGTVLTALMLRRLLEQEHVAEIDFGRGDDAYKQGWAAHRRQYFGLLLVDPRCPSAWPVLARHALGRLRAWVSPGEASMRSAE